MREFSDIRSLKKATLEELTNVNDIGQVSASCIRDFFQEEKNQKILKRLEESGVNMISREQPSGKRLEGLTFVITGTLPNLDRKEAAAMVEDQGGKVSGSVSKKTSYLLAGERAGSKLAKAVELGVLVIDETQFLEMLGKR